MNCIISFTDTASGLITSLTNLEGGRCKDNQMKMKIYVCKEGNDPKCPHGNKGKLWEHFCCLQVEFFSGIFSLCGETVL